MRLSLLFLVVLLAAVAAQPAQSSAPGNVFHFEFVLQCPDEQVSVSGEELFVVERTGQNPTGSQTFHLTDLISGTGVGLETGATYKLEGVGTSVSHRRVSDEFHDTADVFVSRQRVILVPEDGGKALASGHTTIIVLNAEGEFSVFKDLGEFDCVPVPD